MGFSASPPAPTPIPATASSRMARSTSDSVVPFTRGRWQPTESARSSARIGEIAGSTAAECAAICCCFPCGLLGLVVSAVVKLPAGLCRRAYIRRRRRMRALKRKAGLWGPRAGWSLDLDELESVRMKEVEWGIPSAAPSPEVAAMEKEMWTKFYETGFWRSPSQREGR